MPVHAAVIRPCTRPTVAIERVLLIMAPGTYACGLDSYLLSPRSIPVDAGSSKFSKGSATVRCLQDRTRPGYADTANGPRGNRPSGAGQYTELRRCPHAARRLSNSASTVKPVSSANATRLSVEGRFCPCTQEQTVGCVTSSRRASSDWLMRFFRIHLLRRFMPATIPSRYGKCMAFVYHLFCSYRQVLSILNSCRL